MKVSRKEYKNKQNQATGALLVSILAFLMLMFNAYNLYFSEEPFDLVRWIGWIVVFPGMLLVWRRKERKLKEFKTGE